MDLLKTEEIFYTLVSDNISQEIKTKYTNLQITADPQDIDDTKFPTIYIQMLESGEVNPNLVNENISGIRANFQIDIYANEKVVTKEVADEIIRVLKSLAFYINAMPYTMFANGVYRTIIRCNRVIGSGDTL